MDDKYITREVLRKAGVPIPRGVLINPFTDITSVAIQAFISENSGLDGLVVKGLHGAQGKSVWMYGMDEIDHLIDDIKKRDNLNY